MKFRLLIIVVLLTVSCEKSLKEIGDQSVTVFKDVNLNFDMGFEEAPSKLNDGILRLDAGRIIVKKVKLPNYNKQAKVTVNMTLTSNGDPWDKSGSLFVIPKNSNKNSLDFETGKFDLSTLNQAYPVVKAFRNDSVNYQPNVELIRFMTPFGVGFFNDHERTKNRKPPYIPHWEDEVNWSQDITHLLPLLEGEVYIGVYIDTWTKKGYNLSVNLDFEESKIGYHKKKSQTIVSLVNTNKYASAQRLYDDFSKQPLALEFNAETNFKNAKLYVTTTGHGGHSKGDEFIKREHIIDFDGKTLKQWIPWRDDCASFRRFNPSSGTWKANSFMETESEDMIASSDLSRSNWCPGSQVLPEIIDLGNLEKGKHSLKISIPEAQAFTDKENNYWMVSAYIVYDNE